MASTWKEQILEAAGSDVCLLSTATNGLSPFNSQLLGVAILRKCQDGPERRIQLLRKVTRDEVFKSEEYHHISEALMNTTGFDSLEFKIRFNDFVAGSKILTYNVPFQTPFLTAALEEPQRLYDFPLIMKAAESRMIWEAEDMLTLDLMERLFIKCIGKSPSLKQLCKLNRIEPNAPFDILPMTYSCECLGRFFEKLDGVPLVVQDALL